MFPESQILLMMVLPLKAKWIAVAEAVIYVYDFYKGGIFTKVEILCMYPAHVHLLWMDGGGR